MAKKENCILYGKKIQDLAKKGEALFKDLPHLPKSWVKNIVKILPFLVLIGGIFSLLSGFQNLFAFNRNRALIMHWMQINRTYYYVTAAFSIVTGALYLMSYKFLKDKDYKGWLLLFCASILSLAQSIVLLIFGWGGLFASIIAAIISFYLIYEIRAEFNTKEAKASDSQKGKKTK
jgi:fatty acid desaturase